MDYRSTLYRPSVGKTFSDLQFKGKVLYVGIEIIGSTICASITGPGEAHKNPFFGTSAMSSNEELSLKKLSDKLRLEGFIGELKPREVK